MACGTQTGSSIGSPASGSPLPPSAGVSPPSVTGSPPSSGSPASTSSPDPVHPIPTESAKTRRKKGLQATRIDGKCIFLIPMSQEGHQHGRLWCRPPHQGVGPSKVPRCCLVAKKPFKTAHLASPALRTSRPHTKNAHDLKSAESRCLTKAPIDGDSGSAATGREVMDQATLRRRSCFYFG